ncbi:MAG: hypothetical protein AAF921_17140, partial [Cyanobacteria bacterium P01_D01_bin.44]
MKQIGTFSILLLLTTTLPAFAQAQPAAADLKSESMTALDGGLAQSEPVPAEPTPTGSTATVEIIGIQLTETETGFTLLLETQGELSAPETSTTGNAVIANIPNAVLRLPEGDDFFASNAAEGIA